MSISRTLYETLRWECRSINEIGPKGIPCPARGFGSGLDIADVARIETESGDHHRETGHPVEIIRETRKRYDKAPDE